MARTRKTAAALIESDEIPVNIESMDAQRLEWNIGHFVEMTDTKKIDFDNPVQRGYVWNNSKDSLLIRSILRRVPISNFYFNKVNGVYENIEGKQRGSAIYRFVKGLYKLHANTPPIIVDGETYNIARKTFDQLPTPLQNRILRYAIDGHYFDNMSLDEKVEFFILTNSGKPVTAAEISRIRIKSRKVFLLLTEHPAIVLGISEKNKRRCRDEDILAQLWCLCFSDTKSLLQKEIGPILAENEVTEEQKNKLSEALDYLLSLYKEVGDQKQVLNKMRKITHILSLTYMAYLAIENGIPQEIYVEKAMELFSAEGRTATINPEYNSAVGAGSAKADQLRIRIQELKKTLEI